MLLLIVYDTLTLNNKRFVTKLDIPSVRITEGLVVNEPFVLVSYTVEGETPQTTWDFLERNNSSMIGVASSGHPNWAASGNLCKCADNIHEKYGVPIVHKFYSCGTKADRKIFLEGVQNLYAELSRT